MLSETPGDTLSPPGFAQRVRSDVRTGGREAQLDAGSGWGELQHDRRVSRGAELQRDRALRGPQGVAAAATGFARLSAIGPDPLQGS